MGTSTFCSVYRRNYFGKLYFCRTNKRINLSRGDSDKHLWWNLWYNEQKTEHWLMGINSNKYPECSPRETFQTICPLRSTTEQFDMQIVWNSLSRDVYFSCIINHSLEINVYKLCVTIIACIVCNTCNVDPLPVLDSYKIGHHFSVQYLLAFLFFSWEIRSTYSTAKRGPYWINCVSKWENITHSFECLTNCCIYLG